jgi:hypothetical protein
VSARGITEDELMRGYSNPPVAMTLQHTSADSRDQADMATQPAAVEPVEKSGTNFVDKGLAGAASPSDDGVAYQGTQPITGGLRMTLGSQPANRADEVSTNLVDKFPRAPHTPVPHELRNALATARTLVNQLEIADMRPEMRTALWLREQILVALLELQGYVEVPLSERPRDFVAELRRAQAEPEEVMPDPA